MPIAIRARDMHAAITGFIFIEPISKRQVRLYFKQDIDALIEYLADKAGVADQYKTARFWHQRSLGCAPVLRMERILKKGVRKPKQIGDTRYDFRFTRHCEGSCAIPGHECRNPLPKEIGRLCDCFPRV